MPREGTVNLNRSRGFRDRSQVGKSAPKAIRNHRDGWANAPQHNAK